MRTVRSCFGQRAARRSHLVAAQVANVGAAFVDELDGPIVQLLEVVGRIDGLVAEIAAQPFHILDDRVNVLRLFLRRVRVVEAQVALPAKLFRDAEVERNALRVADVQVAVRLGRKAGVHTSVMFPALLVGENQVANKIRTG